MSCGPTLDFSEDTNTICIDLYGMAIQPLVLVGARIRPNSILKAQLNRLTRLADWHQMAIYPEEETTLASSLG